MDGIHDLGGKQGFGAVDTEVAAEAFEARWQAAVFAMTGALYRANVTQNTDQFRHAIERIDPVSYLTDGYYGRWLGGIETLLVEAGRMSQADIDARLIEMGHALTARIAARPDPNAIPFTQNSEHSGAQRPLQREAKFNLGQGRGFRLLPLG